MTWYERSICGLTKIAKVLGLPSSWVPALCKVSPIYPVGYPVGQIKKRLRSSGCLSWFNAEQSTSGSDSLQLNIHKPIHRICRICTQGFTPALHEPLATLKPTASTSQTTVTRRSVPFLSAVVDCMKEGYGHGSTKKDILVYLIEVEVEVCVMHQRSSIVIIIKMP